MYTLGVTTRTNREILPHQADSSQAYACTLEHRREHPFEAFAWLVCSCWTDCGNEYAQCVGADALLYWPVSPGPPATLSARVIE